MTTPTLPTSLVNVKMGNLLPHPAQMRTIYEMGAMAELALQVYHNQGVDSWNPIVVTPIADSDQYHIVSGHRRRMATLFSWGVDLWLAQQSEPSAQQSAFTLETMTEFLQTLLSKYTDIESAADALALKFAERNTEVALFHGNTKAQILALQRANYGSETPDLLGVALSLRAALDAGASEHEIARNMGQSLAFVQKHLALTRIAPELADLIAANKVPMSVAQIVGDLQPDSARHGMALFVVTNVGQVTAEGLKACARALTGWHQFATMPMTLAHQGQRNMIRILANLWVEQVTAKPVQTWANVVSLVYRGINHTNPWENQSAYSEWIRLLGGDTYFREDGSGIQWHALVQALLPQVACDTCPLARLPERLLQQDLADRPGVLGRPCRTPERDTFTRCINGFADHDPLEVRVPFAWAEHPTVTKQGQFYLVDSVEALEAAWHAQAIAEEKEIVVEEAMVTEGNPIAPVVASTPPNTSIPVPASTPAVIAPTSIPVLEAEPSASSPIAKMRAQIGGYMQSHTREAVHHPFATPCGGCQHKLTQSPTKDTSLPHCAWAGRLRTVQFLTIQDATHQLVIPICRQYAPNRPWQDLIPAHPAPATLPRDYLLSQIRFHVKEADRATNSDRHPFEFLTGRPLGTESYATWFETQLTEQVGTLTDAQLFTLFVWSLSEYERARHPNTFTLPTDPHATAFLTVSELPRSVP